MDILNIFSWKNSIRQLHFSANSSESNINLHIIFYSFIDISIFLLFFYLFHFMPSILSLIFPLGFPPVSIYGFVGISFVQNILQSDYCTANNLSLSINPVSLYFFTKQQYIVSYSSTYLIILAARICLLKFVCIFRGRSRQQNIMANFILMLNRIIYEPSETFQIQQKLEKYICKQIITARYFLNIFMHIWVLFIFKFPNCLAILQSIIYSNLLLVSYHKFYSHFIFLQSVTTRANYFQAQISIFFQILPSLSPTFLFSHTVYILLYSLLYFIMQNRPYKFYYLRRHHTKELLQKFVHKLDKEDEKNFIKQIGQFLYEFKIEDKYSSWTVLKTFDEIELFMEEKQNSNMYFKFAFFTKKVANIEDFKDQQFQLKQLRINEIGSIIPQHVIKFFEIYNTNIYKITSLKMFKKVRGLTWIKKCHNWCCGVEWVPKRIIVTQQGMLEMADDGTVTDFLKFDMYFNLQSGTAATGHQFGVALYSAQRKVVLKTFYVKDFINFLFYTTKAMESRKTGINYLAASKPKQGNKIDYLIDAQSYYREVAIQIKRAKRDIFICGWWISPQLYLIRPTTPQNLPYRLDNLLKKKAEQGVKIYIVVFLAPSIIPNDSDYTKRALASLHPNIIVERHPHEFLPKLWSHHEKIVVIDQKVALMGGLDLCYGRYDSSAHPVNKNDKEMYPGIDYNNVRIKDFIQVCKFEADLQDRNLPRLPWHDVAFKVTGKMVADVANHFIQYWNFTLLEKKVVPIVYKKKDSDCQVSKQNLQANKALLNTNQLINNILKLAMQKLNEKDKEQMEQFIQNKSRRDKFISVIRAQWLKRFQFNNGAGQNCLILSIESLGLIKIDEYTREENNKIYSDELQLLRSASQWSIGLEQGVTQRSIQNAYISIIKNAKSFIYIENQFFISATGEKQSYVQNQVANALYERIKKAIQKNQKFRVVIFMPLLPGMEGQLTQNCPLSIKLTLFWQYNTISQSEQALIPRVAKLTPHPQDYIEFYSLRNHGILINQPVTQLIYIHTKLIIVDDDIVLCGSANINDRSLQGDRDSELAVIFTNGEKTIRRMNGERCEVNRKAHNLRSKLYREHFAISEQQAQDPLNDFTIKLMRNIAKVNTQTYRQIFGCCPDDNVKKLSAVRNFQKIPDKAKYQSLSPNIRGHAVQFPTMFLSQQKLYGFDLDIVQDIFT